MNVNFFDSEFQQVSNKKRFGLCDDPPPAQTPAYLDEKDGRKWIAVVVNEFKFNVLFIPVDNCIELRKKDGRMDSRCDALLSYNSTIIFVELKQRVGNDWIKEGDKQLRSTIKHFEKTEDSTNFHTKRACIANSKKTKFRTSQATRMNKFHKDTGYILRIENRISLE